jgi:AcrR family transcriptional regulator
MNGTKEHIIQVTSLLFLQKNFKEVTMKEIVDRTGLSKGAFYHYFTSKEHLFQEVLDYFFQSISHNYESYSKESFRQYYKDYITDTIELSRQYLQRFSQEMNEISLTMNYFTLIFDALKLFPDFREKIVLGFQVELDHWEAAVRRSRQSGEIRSSLSDREIAEIFMYLSDGIGMHMIMRGEDIENMMKPIQILWDTLYDQMKV